MARRKRSKSTWALVDLHLHTPASSDYLQTGVSYLDILQAAEAKGVDIIAFTDHNTIAGYREMEEEIESLELLERVEPRPEREFPDSSSSSWLMP